MFRNNSSSSKYKSTYNTIVSINKEYRFAAFFLQNKAKEYTSHGSLTLLLVVIYIILIYILINSKI